MRRTVFRYLAASSLLFAVSNGAAATRPRYGETMIVEIEAGLSSADASGRSEDFAEARALNKLRALIGDRLVRLDSSGRPQPALAISWEHDRANVKWTFKLRPAVSWHDGSGVTATDVAATLAGLVPNRPWSGACARPSPARSIAPRYKRSCSRITGNPREQSCPSG